MTKEFLEQLWSDIRKCPAWLTIAKEQLNLSQEDEDYLTDLEDGHQKALREIQAFRNPHNHRPEVDLNWAMERRREYLTTNLFRLRRVLTDTRIAIARATASKDPVSVAMEQYDENEVSRQISKTEAAIKNLIRPIAGKESQITEGMIEKARQYPIKRLAGTENERIPCPIHQGTNLSMTLKNGFAYCFQCSVRLDPIAWVMRLNGVSFPDAVRQLQ